MNTAPYETIGPHWSSMSLTVRGLHKGPTDSCQDRAAHWQVDDRAVLLAIADGAGSASAGGHGAQSFVDQVATRVLRTEWKPILTSEPDVARSAVEAVVRSAINDARRELEQLNADLRVFNSTAGVCLVTQRFVVVCAIGDVFACVRSRLDPTDLKLVLSPERAGARDNGTFFYTMPDWATHLESLVIVDPTIEAVFLSSDGLEDAALQFDYPDRQAAVDSNIAQPVEVRLVPDILRFVESDFDASRLAREIDVPEILSTKGDDVGFALAIRR